MSINVCHQCEAITSKKKRCKNNTCVTSPFCAIHTQYQQGLRVKKSTIPNANLGLFTTVPRKKGENIVNYTGEILTQQEFEKRYPKGNAAYALQAGKHIIDAIRTDSSVGRYANHKSKTRGANAKFVASSGKARIQATKPILKNEEIFVPYGKSFKI